MNNVLVDKLVRVHCSKCMLLDDCGGCDVRTKIEDILEGENIGKRPRRGVYCITTDMTFETLKEASDHYNVVSATISKCCKGKLKFAGRFGGQKLKWRYVDNGL